MIKAKRKIALVTAVILVLLLCFSFAYIAAEQGHNCIGEDCLICPKLLVCEAVFNAMGTATVFLSVAVLVIGGYTHFKNENYIALEKVDTPVTLKTKLSY